MELYEIAKRNEEHSRRRFRIMHRERKNRKIYRM